MDFSDPMVLANAMIFHDSISSQLHMNKPTQILSHHQLYLGPRFDKNGVYYDNVASEHTFQPPIQDFINSPITLETINGTVYMKMVMGKLEDTILLVSIFFDSPKISQIPIIKMTIMQRIKEFKEEEDEVIIVISGKRSKEFDNELVTHSKLLSIKNGNKLILR